jgi:hypothetical protein
MRTFLIILVLFALTFPVLAQCEFYIGEPRYQCVEAMSNFNFSKFENCDTRYLGYQFNSAINTGDIYVLSFDNDLKLTKWEIQYFYDPNYMTNTDIWVRNIVLYFVQTLGEPVYSNDNHVAAWYKCGGTFRLTSRYSDIIKATVPILTFTKY